MTVKMPLLRSFWRSFALMLDSRLRSSFSMAIFRQRAWNSHSAQCRFRTRSGGAALESSAAILSRCFRTSPVRAEVFTLNVAWSSPWMILPKPTSRPRIWESTNASNASSSRSSLVSLLRKMKRTGMNCVALPRPSDGTRSTACRGDSMIVAADVRRL